MQLVKVFNALAIFVTAYVEDHVVYKDMLNEEACPWDIDYLTKAFAYYISLGDDDRHYATFPMGNAGYITEFKSNTLNQNILLETICMDLQEALATCKYMTLSNH